MVFTRFLLLSSSWAMPAGRWSGTFSLIFTWFLVSLSFFYFCSKPMRGHKLLIFTILFDINDELLRPAFGGLLTFS